eukprot:UN25438
MINATAKDDNEAIRSTLSSLPHAVEEILVDSTGDNDPEIEKKVLDRHSDIMKEERDLDKIKAKEKESQSTWVEQHELENWKRKSRIILKKRRRKPKRQLLLY